MIMVQVSGKREQKVFHKDNLLEEDLKEIVWVKRDRIVKLLLTLRMINLSIQMKRI